MAAAGRRTEDSVAEKLLNESHGFDFFEAVRLLMRLMPGRRPVGAAAKPKEEVVRFRSRVSLAFPASPIHEIERNPKGGGPPEMSINFMGLMGTQGVLPFLYTEHMLYRQAAKDTAMASFFDLFNHRWISLFYRAWEKHRLPVAYERAALEKAPVDRICHYLFDLIGIGTLGLRRRLEVRDEALLYYSGLLVQRPRSAVNLRAVLRDYFRVEVAIDQCLGAWYDLEARDRSYMDREGLNNQLGEGAIAGDQIWDQQSRFRIRLGPLDAEQFRAFLPDGKAARELESLTRLFVGPTLAFDLQLILQAPKVPWCRLEEVTAEPVGLAAPRLGWNTWLKTEELARDPDDAMFSLAA